jgi:hypothetical protein
VLIVAHGQRIFALTKRSEMKVLRKALGFFLWRTREAVRREKRHTL